MEDPLISSAIESIAARRAALEAADIVPLVMVLVQFTGDMHLLDRCEPYIKGPFDAQQRIPAALRLEVVDKLLAVLDRYWKGELEMPPAPPDETQFVRMMSIAVGRLVPPKYVEMMRDDFQFGEKNAGGLNWTRPPERERLERFRVAIVGAGVSGILAAIRLKQAGVAFTVFDKNAAVGGTWYENRYPGCGCDTPNHFYSYSFELNAGWSEYYVKRDELWAYCLDCVEKYGITAHLRLNTEVLGAQYDQNSHAWHVSSRAAGAQPRVDSYNAVICAVGQLNRPSVPYISGAETFEGPAFHTAAWDSTVTIEGRRVAIVGTGASAMQVGPAIADKVRHLAIFQRSAQWMIPNANYHRAVTAEVQWVLANVPFYSRWYRFQLFWAFGDALYEHLRIDPTWPTPDISLNKKNHEFRSFALSHIEKEMGDDPEMMKKVVPNYPIFGKRLLMDNRWYKTLRRPNVSLVTTAIRSIDRNGIVTEDGAHHDVDIIIYATGFQAQKMLVPMEINGVGGERLHDRWADDDPRAYLGITVPGFPNLFIIYGPNTNLAHGGSAIFNSECQIRYTMRAIQLLIENGYSAMDVRRDVHDEYNEKVDAATSRMVWAHKGMTNWYKNSKGRVTQNSPWSMADYWHMTSEVNPDDYNFARS
jgi:4-hydroxyacetophenone monooxygenase